MVENVIPKVFISYSWTKSDLVLQVANRLMSHGVEVVLDKWDLKEGQDKYVFMEQCVNNSDITKVLIFCDKTYTEKANNRTGGVGDETVIFKEYGPETLPEYIRVLSLEDYFSEKVTGSYAIKTIQNAWKTSKDSFEIYPRTNELCYNAGATYEADRILKELPETLEVRKSRDCLMMNLEEAQKFFGITFKKPLFPWLSKIFA